MLARIRELFSNGRKSVVLLEIDKDARSIEGYRGKELDVNFKQYSARRSLSQNAYYWALITDVAAVLGISTARLHNTLLREHPRFEMFGEKNAFISIEDTEDAEIKALESTTVHLYPTSSVTIGTNGTTYRTYKLLRGSKEYTVQEMTVLLEDLIAEAKGLGIDTATPDELARMRQYDERQEQKNGENEQEQRESRRT